MLTVACQQPQVMLSINTPYKHCLFYTKLYSNQKTVHTQLYTDKYTLRCCSLYFLLWVLELSKRHASAQVEHRYMTQNVLCHMNGTVNA